MASSTILEIERAIETLNPQELVKLYRWLEQNHPEPIDARLPSDLAAGRLDSAILRASGDEQAESMAPNPPVERPLQTAADIVLFHMRQVPPEMMATMPTDGASQHDHYIYGWPKREV
jgi:hypothetical protein